MLVLITYDVNTETAAGRKRLRKLQSNARIMEDECRILFSNAFWTMLSVLL